MSQIASKDGLPFAVALCFTVTVRCARQLPRPTTSLRRAVMKAYPIPVVS